MALPHDATDTGSVGVVIVNYNTRDHLRACLQTVRAEAPSEVVVVDNASSDGSAEMVRTEYPEAVLHANTTNPGYGAGANLGIGACRARYALLLNSDTRLPHGALAVLASYLDRHQHVGIVGPRLVNPDGSLQPSCYPFLTPLNVLVLNTLLSDVVRHVPILRERFHPAWPKDDARAVAWVKGAALAIRREAFEAVGGFDESYFMYSEELDLCYRLRDAGWETHFVPSTSVTHVEGASTMQYRPQMFSAFFASIKHFYRRHYSPRSLRRLRLAVSAVLWQRIVKDTVRLQWTTDPLRRRRFAEDVLMWRRILEEQRREDT